MVSVAIVSQPIFMTTAATLVTGHFEMSVLRRLDLVRCMAIGADRSALVIPGQKLAMHTLVLGLLDADVAFTAGFGHVAGMNR